MFYISGASLEKNHYLDSRKESNPLLDKIDEVLNKIKNLYTQKSSIEDCYSSGMEMAEQTSEVILKLYNDIQDPVCYDDCYSEMNSVCNSVLSFVDKLDSFNHNIHHFITGFRTCAERFKKMATDQKAAHLAGRSIT